MKKALSIALIGLALLYGCAPGAAATAPRQSLDKPSPAVSTPGSAASPSATTPQSSAPDEDSATIAPHSPAAGRTPDPASEMLVTGTVLAVLDNTMIEVKSDSLGRSVLVSMLHRAEYAEGVAKKFKQGNRVRIITSNKFAKTLPERVAAVLVLENSDK